MDMTVGKLLKFINQESGGNINNEQPFEVFGSLDGKKYEIVEFYVEDGIMCLDIKAVEQ